MLLFRVLLAAGLCLAVPGPVSAAQMASHTAPAHGDVALYRLFLTDGSVLVSYGEYARVGDEVVFSMPLGAATDRLVGLQLITVPAEWVDWPRTERYARTVRYERYAATRGDADFEKLTADVAELLNQIEDATEPERAMAIADEARRRLITWSASNQGYRLDDIREIVGLIDEAVSGVGRGRASVQLSLIETHPPTGEAILGMPRPLEQVDRLVGLAQRMDRPADRVTLLRAALALVRDPRSAIEDADARRIRRTLEREVREEEAADDRYARLVERLLRDARGASARADVDGVERLLTTLERDDARFGGKRPQIVESLRATLREELRAARDLRLQRDQWLVRRRVYRAYEKDVRTHMRDLARAQSSLQDIRRLAGPAPRRLAELRERLAGGATRLAGMAAPDALRAAHDMLVAAWRFAEQAAETRERAVATADLDEAWRASSAAAGSMMLLAQAQEAIRGALEPPALRR